MIIFLENAHLRNLQSKLCYIFHTSREQNLTITVLDMFQDFYDVYAGFLYSMFFFSNQIVNQ